MRDLHWGEKDAVILKNVETTFSPYFKQTIITTEKLKGKIICRIERRFKYTLPLSKTLRGSLFASDLPADDRKNKQSLTAALIKEAGPMKGGED